MKLLGLALLTLPLSVFSQRQLVIIRGDRPVAWFTEGNMIDFVLKKGGGKRYERIVELSEFSMITSGDTIMLNEIGKIKTKNRKGEDFARGFGGLFFVGGLVLLGVETLNSATGYSSPEIDAPVVKVSLGLMAVGTLLVLLHPRYERMGYRVILRSVDYKSPFYLH